MLKTSKKYINIFLLSSEWEYYHRKYFTLSITEKLSGKSDIIAVQYPLSLIVNLFVKFKRRFVGYLKGNYSAVKVNNIVLYTPVILFHDLLWKKCSIFLYIDAYLLKFQLGWFLKRNFHDSRKILWVYLPHHYYLSKILNYDYMIYDSYDDNEYDYDGNRNLKVAQINKKLVEKSDYNITVSKFTYERFIKYSSKVIYLTNGNDYESITKANNKIPADLKEVNLPIIGYLGTVRNWINFELISQMSNELPECKIVFVGGISRDSVKIVNLLSSYSNIIFLGHKDPAELPSYLKSFSVGIIPFRINNFTKSVFPNKFFEYIAASIPVVTTALPEMHKYKEVIGFAKNNEEFINFCRDGINGLYIDKISSYKDIASKNSWNNKAEELYDNLINVIPGL